MRRVLTGLLGIPVAYAIFAFIEAEPNPFNWVPVVRMFVVMLSSFFIYVITSSPHWSRK